MEVAQVISSQVSITAQFSADDFSNGIFSTARSMSFAKFGK